MQRITLALQSGELTIAALFSALICLSGCVGVLPDHAVYEGSEITVESLKWLHSGETTRAQILEKFGPPNVDFVDQHTIAYAWSGSFGVVVIFSPDLMRPIRMRQALMISFDSVDKVAEFSIIDRPTNMVRYDVLDQSSAAHSGEWKAILDQWLAQRRRVHDQSEVMPK